MAKIRIVTVDTWDGVWRGILLLAAHVQVELVLHLPSGLPSGCGDGCYATIEEAG